MPRWLIYGHWSSVFSKRNILLNHVDHWTQPERAMLKSLIVASAEPKGIQAQADSMSDPKIMKMAAKGYEDMAAEVDGPLTAFDDIYQQALKFYEGLPWSNPRDRTRHSRNPKISLNFFREAWESVSILKAESLPPELTNENT